MKSTSCYTKFQQHVFQFLPNFRSELYFTKIINLQNTGTNFMSSERNYKHQAEVEQSFSIDFKISFTLYLNLKKYPTTDRQLVGTFPQKNTNWDKRM